MFERQERLVEAVRKAAAALGEEEYALVGGMAVGVRGRPRGTIDADIMLAVPRIRLPKVLEGMQAAGFRLNVLEALAELRDDQLTHVMWGDVQVDLMGSPLPAFAEVVRTARWEDFYGSRVRVITAEGLLFMKLLAFRPQDQADLWSILADNRGRVDVAVIRRLYEQVGEVGDERWQYLEQVMRELDEAAGQQ